VLERVFHDGRYSMPGRGMSQGMIFESKYVYRVDLFY
jgi:hypothetical protein